MRRKSNEGMYVISREGRAGQVLARRQGDVREAVGVILTRGNASKMWMAVVCNTHLAG